MDQFYNAVWTTTGLSETKKYLIRTSVGTISGEESTMEPTVKDCIIKHSVE